MMKQIKEIPMTKKAQELVKKLEEAPRKAYCLVAMNARPNKDPRAKGIKISLNMLFREETLARLPRNPVAIGAAVGSAQEVVQALGSDPTLKGRDRVIQKAVDFKTLLTQPPQNAC